MAAAVERRIVVVRHARHDQGPALAECREQRIDESVRPALYRRDPRERRVDEQHAAALDSELVELLYQLVSSQMAPETDVPYCTCNEQSAEVKPDGARARLSFNA